MQWFTKWLESATAQWTLLDWLAALGSIAAVVGVVGGVIYWIISRIVRYVLRRKEARRQERDQVRALLTFLWTRRVLDSPLYQEDPRGSLGSVREIRVRLRQDLEGLPSESAVLRSLREMHEACLEFLNRIEPLPMPRDSEPLPSVWLGGAYWETLGDALTLLRRTFEPCMDQLYEAYGIDKPRPRVQVMYIEPLFMPSGNVSYPLPRYPKDITKVSLRVLRTLDDLADSKPTNLVLRKDAAIKAWLKTDQFDTVVGLLIAAGFVERDEGNRREAYRITPEGIGKVERYQLIAQGLNPDTGKPLQE